MITYPAIRDGILSSSDETAQLALHLDRMAQQIAECPADFTDFLHDSAGDEDLADPGAPALLQRAIRANSLLVEAMKSLRQAIVRAQAAAKAEEKR